VSVYCLHALVPDLLDYRDLNRPNDINREVPVVETFRGLATPVMRERGLANWGLSLGRQRLGALALHNHPRFLQNLHMNQLQGTTKTIDGAALDIIRDRERGVPRFNEFRRQYGLRSLTSFDDFISQTANASDRSAQTVLVKTLRDIYGQHPCNSAVQITVAQRGIDDMPINDCYGKANGTPIDNVEDLDTMGGLAGRIHPPTGFAISETRLVVFILNASRRLYSDRFFTSSFRPELYSKFGIDWVNNSGPEALCGTFLVNGDSNEPISPLKRILLRTIPELADELAPVANAFDPWARDRGRYYSLDWKPRRGAERDPAFATP
jgi:Animal haem peroxidase